MTVNKSKVFHSGEKCYCAVGGRIVEVICPAIAQRGNGTKYIIQDGNMLRTVNDAYLYKRYDLNPGIDYSEDNDSDFERWKRQKEK